VKIPLPTFKQQKKHFELLSNLTKNTDDYRPEKDKDKELQNYSGCLQGKSVHKENISMGNFRITTRVSKHTCKKHISAINRNQQAHSKDSTHTIPVLVNDLTSMDASMKNVCHKPKSSYQQNKEEDKIIIIGDSQLKTLQVMWNIISMTSIGVVVL
jgi:hypothetical protein